MMRVIDAGPDNTGGVARPVGTVACPGFDAHDWRAARVGTDIHWWQCTECEVLATTAELQEAEEAAAPAFDPRHAPRHASV